MLISIPVNTADILDQFPASDFFHGLRSDLRIRPADININYRHRQIPRPTPASSGVSGRVASRSRFLKSQVLVVSIPPQEVPEPVEAFRIKSHRSIECEASNKNKF
ncbi:hypothetical protein PGTUg99_007304 [Puccinia graminis f. sp. tritici]|uniref:Uncharacterized protein n=1 Tax=Puccinia graminis f. sp. tritici TaxID=56615 RepID=A0A5B0SLR0_PUCGR|nr:hypothetical protein PGTUg99_007304 [Puccinia graminis f. sp. tritici]